MLRRAVPVVILLAMIFIAGVVSAQTHKLRISDPVLAQEMIARGGKFIADYGSFQVIESSEAPANRREAERVQNEDHLDVIELNVRPLNTRTPEVRAMRRARGAFGGKQLHLVHFAGPIKPEWLAALENNGGRIVTYIPNNAYLIYGDFPSLRRMQSWAGGADYVQWDGDYADDYKINPRARLTDDNGQPQTPETDLFAIQMVDDPEANAATLRVIDRLRLAPVQSESHVLNYLNVIVRLPPDRLGEIAAQPEVISIQPYLERHLLDERQDQIIAGNLTNNFSSPSGPGYLAWLAAKGFTQAQFTNSGFVVDVTDSGIDNGTTTPGHFGLFQFGNPTMNSRVIYNRLFGNPHSGSTLQGCDGHGTINAHIIAGYSNLKTNGFVHTDTTGYQYDLGVCPFVKVGSSVVFDPKTFTVSGTKEFFRLQSEAYRDGARISANSWGANVGGDYDVDSQAYDALVRNASTNFVGTNRQMVIVFAAGNADSSSGTMDSPGSAKNVITVGAAENVRSLSTTNGGNSFSGLDGSQVADSGANNPNDIINFSSRGPCSDGRMKPDLVAPGTHITGGAPQSGVATTNGTGNGLACFDASGVSALTRANPAVTGSISNYFPLGQQFYTESSGTSHSTPCVAGACALLRQYFINHSLSPPSPAMTKAFLMNSARYLTGTSANDNLWSPNQGMGGLDLGMALDGVPRVLRDQLAADIFTNTGPTRVITGTIPNNDQPFRVTLAWTDAPGNTTGNAFNNDLDLTVTVGGNTYNGNVFDGALSTSGGSADRKNNVESVFLPAGVSGNFVVSVNAANIVSDGISNQPPVLDQDFALVIYNAVQLTNPVVVINSATLAAEDCAPTNGAIDAGEMVTVNFTLNNIGTANTTNLVVTLLATNGITSPSDPQNYGMLLTNGAVVSRPFSFTASGACGETITAVLQLQDGSNNLGTLTYDFTLGAVSVAARSYTNAGVILVPASGTSGSANPYPSTIAVSGFTGTVNKVTVTLRGMYHIRPDDFDILLVGPAGQKVLFMSDCGGNNPVTNVTLTFDDDAASALPDATQITSGTYLPSNYSGGSDTFPSPAPSSPYDSTLSAFNNQNPNGNWSLYVNDDANNLSGHITNGWSLTLISTNHICCAGVVANADLVVDQSVSPSVLNVTSNLIFTINVTNLGPDAANAVVLTDSVPVGLNFVTATVSQGTWTNSGNLVSAAFGTLTNGNTTTMTIQATAAIAGQRTNVVTVSCSTADTNLTNNATSATVSVNSFPTITGITNVITAEDMTAGPIGFFIGDAETAATALVLSATSSNTNLVSQTNIVFGGVGANRTVTLTPLTNQNGVCTITLTVSDGSAATNMSFTLTVNSVNDAPVLAPIANRTVHAGTLVVVTNIATDVDLPPDVLTFSLDLGAPVTATINSSNGLFNWLTSDTQANTTNPVTVRVTDNGAPPLSDTREFMITVMPRPFITSISVSNEIAIINWSSISGQTYQVLANGDLLNTNWTNLIPDTTALGTNTAAMDFIGTNAQKFYRVTPLP